MTPPLATYLHDHLGAANFAIELLEKWRSDPTLPGLAAWARPLLDEIDADRETLRAIIQRVGEPPHTFKEKLGWLGEKLSRPKLSKGDTPEFAHFEGLEILALGILGKVSLWEALRVLAPGDSRLVSFDYTQLLARAHRQHATVESRRRDFVRSALTSSSNARQ
jgi:hypothetical protein